MPKNLKQLSHSPARLSAGHRLCPGCGEPTVVRQVLMSTDDPVIVCNATGCLEVSTTIFPYTAWNVPWVHLAFENAAATASGVESMYKKYKADQRNGKPIPEYVDPDANYKFVAFAGDGGTYDIGLQSLSGAAERGHQFLYVCLNNEAYMNTGVQCSGATPLGSDTTTTPAGRVKPGKERAQKDLTGIMAAHDIPYVAQACSGRWRDLTSKAEKALAIDGPTFINCLSPCPLGWSFDPSRSVELAQLAADCCIWPLYEVEYGVWKLTFKPKEKQPIDEYLQAQGRFRHMFKDERGKEWRQKLQDYVDGKWEQILKRCGEG